MPFVTLDGGRIKRKTNNEDTLVFIVNIENSILFTIVYYMCLSFLLYFWTLSEKDILPLNFLNFKICAKILHLYT